MEDRVAMEPQSTFARWLWPVMGLTAVSVAAACWFLYKEVRKTLRRTGMPAEITWTCHVCGEERPDDRIVVFKRDVSTDHDLPIGSMFTNVRH